MAGFEDLIRGALEKQGQPDEQRREAIYASSRTALSRMLQQNDKLDAAAIAMQEERLEAAIKAIEADYAAREPKSAPPPPPPPPGGPPGPRGGCPHGPPVGPPLFPPGRPPPV